MQLPPQLCIVYFSVPCLLLCTLWKINHYHYHYHYSGHLKVFLTVLDIIRNIFYSSTIGLRSVGNTCSCLFFLFFRRQGFRMITFDRQAGPLQYFNRSHVMVIGRSYRFPTPRDPRVGAWGAPNTPKSPPPKKKICMRFRTPGTFLKKLFL